MTRILVHIAVIVISFFLARVGLFYLFPIEAHDMAIANAAGKSFMNLACGFSSFAIWTCFNRVYPLGSLGPRRD